MNQSESHKTTTGNLLTSPPSPRLISGSTTRPHESDDTSQSTKTTDDDDDDDSFVHVMNDNINNDNPPSSSAAATASSAVLVQSTNENTNEISNHPFEYTANDIEEENKDDKDGYVAIVIHGKKQQKDHQSHPNQNQLERNSQNNNNNDNPHQQTSRSNSNTNNNNNNNIPTTNRLTSNEVTLPPPQTLKRTKSYLPEPSSSSSSSSRGVTFDTDRMTLKSRLKKLRIDHNTIVTTTSNNRQQQQQQQQQKQQQQQRRLASINNNNECNTMNRILQTSSSSRRICNSFVSYGSNDTTRNQSTTHHMHHHNHNHKRSHNTNNTKKSNKQQQQQAQQQTTTTANQQHTTNAQKRLLHDFHRLQTNPPPDILAVPADTNILQWDGIIFGPTNSPWEGGIFKLSLTFTEAYPYTAPTVRFVTKMFHPNIDPDGGTIGLTILEEDWNPVYDVMAILVSIQSILCHPLVVPPRSRYYGSDEAQMLFVEDRMEYDRRVRMTVVEQLQQEQQNLCF